MIKAKQLKYDYKVCLCEEAEGRRSNLRMKLLRSLGARNDGMLLRVFPVILLIFAVSTAAVFAEEYIQATAAIDISTTVSDGRYSLPEVAAIARRNNIKIVIPTDGFLNKWEYGLQGLRNIVKKSVETNSVSRFGIKRYLDQINAVQRENRDMIVLDSVETGPFYYWTGKPFDGTFAIRDWHKHLLVIGLNDENAYRNLPVVGNGFSLAKPFVAKNILYLIPPIAVLAAGLFCIWIGSFADPGYYVRRFGLRLRDWNYAGVLFIVASAAVAINSYPFRDFKYDQYHGDRGAMPYQNMIDYVNERGGVTFWEHPEAKNIENAGNIRVETGEHADYLLLTCNYTGFAVFHEGYDSIGAPGLIWDEALKDYCIGIRPSPVWAIGALDFEKAGSLDQYMAGLRTVFLLSQFTKADALNALKEGRMYVSKDAEAANFILDTFTVKDPLGSSEKIMGQELAMVGSPRITIEGHFINSPADAPAKNVKIALIRNGEIIKEFGLTAPFKIDFDDNDDINDRKFYYRMEIRSEGLVSVTNPIFVSRK